MEKLRKDYIRVRSVLEKILINCGLAEEVPLSEFFEKDVKQMRYDELFKDVGEMRSLAATLLEKHFLESWIEIIKEGYEPDKQTEMIDVVKLLIQRDPLNVYEHYSEFFRILNGLNSEDEKEREQTLLQIQNFASEMTSEDVINKLFELTKTRHSEDVMLALIDGSSKCHKNFPHYVEACLGNHVQKGE